MTPWEARIVGADWAPKWSRKPQRNNTPPSRWKAGDNTSSRGPQRSGSVRGTPKPGCGSVQPESPIQDGGAICSRPYGSPSPPPSSYCTQQHTTGHRDTWEKTGRSYHQLSPCGRGGTPSSQWRTSKRGGACTAMPCPTRAASQGPSSSCSPPTSPPRYAACCATTWKREVARRPDGALLALLYRNGSAEHRWDALLAHLDGHHTYMSAAPEHPRPEWEDLIAASQNHGLHPTDTWQAVREKTLSRDNQRRVCARLLELQDSLRRRWDDCWLRLGPWSPASHSVLHAAGRYQQVHAVLPGGRMPLAGATPGPVAAHGGGGTATAHQGRLDPFTGPGGPRGSCPPIDPRAPEAPHVYRTLVAPVRELVTTRHRALREPYHNAPRLGDRQTHARARRRVQEAATRDLVASAVAEAHTAHAAASQEPAGSVGTFLQDAALPAL